jgi:Spx/MgsR family transcriptional regulator
VTTLFGIKNCDTVKKARNWLESHAIDYQFHDFRSDGLTEKQLKAWIAELGWEQLVNKRSTTWKQLPPATREQMDEALAITTMLANPTLIKRPVLDTGDERSVGFKEAAYASLFKHHTL